MTLYIPKPADPVLNRDLDIIKELRLAMPLTEYGSTIIKDLSGCHNDGALEGGAHWTESLTDHCIDLSLDGEYITIPDAPSLDPTTELTISIYLKPTLLGGSGNRTFSKWGDAGLRTWHLYFDNSGAILFFMSSDGAKFRYENLSGFTLTANIWQQITITYKGGDGVCIYVNADEKTLGAGGGTEGLPSSLYNSTTPIDIGRSRDTPMTNYWYTGLVNYPFIWHRVLNYSEILQIYEDPAWIYRYYEMIYGKSVIASASKLINDNPLIGHKLMNGSLVS